MTPPTHDPTTPGDSERRFTIGLVLDVAKVLEDHGYDRLEPAHYVELQQHLLHFLYGGADRCYGGTVAAADPIDAALGEHRRQVADKLDALRQSEASTSAAIARYDQRRGLGR